MGYVIESVAKMDAGYLDAVSVSFKLVASLIHDEPKEDTVRLFIDEGVFDEAPFGGTCPSVRRGLELMQRWCLDASSDSFPEMFQSLRREWLRLFVGLGAPEAPCWESFYYERDHTVFGKRTLEVRGLYRKYGLEIPELRREPDDHLSFMLQFLVALMSFEERVESAGDKVGAQQIVGVQKDFIVEHVLPWIGAWRKLVREGAHSDFYRGVGELAFGFLQVYAERFSIVCDDERGIFTVHKATSEKLGEQA